MKASEIKVGGLYLAKVGGVITKVKVTRIRVTHGGSTAYDVTNTTTGAKTTFYSAAKFRGEVPETTVEDHVNARIQQVANELMDMSKPPVEDGTCPFAGPTSETGAGASTTSPSPMEGEQCQNPTPMMEVSTPVHSAHTTTAMEPVTGSTKEDEQSQHPTTDVLSVEEKPTGMTSAPTTAPVASMLASRIASAQVGRRRGELVAGMVPNEEQEAILAQAVERGLKVLVVGAGAGTGKTATLKMLEQTIPGRGQYTAFNAALVAEAKEKFKKCAVNTTHSLAFKSVGKLYAHRLPGKSGAVARMRSEQIARFLGIESFTVTLKGQGAPDEEGKPTDRVKTLQPAFLAGQVMVACQRFCQSADHEISGRHFKYIDGLDEPGSIENNNLIKEYLVKFAKKAWDDLSSTTGQLPFSHDVYVKLWQLGEGDERPVIASDYILLDEAQDTAPVFLDILKQQTHALLVFVGDSNQAIYEWRGAVDAMKAYPDAPRKLLSQSYRFGQAIADVANTILAELEEPTDLMMRGLPSIPSRVAPVAEPRCYLYRTNAGAIGQVMMAVGEGKRPFLLGNIKEAMDFCKAALDLQNRMPTSHPDLGCFSDWEEVEEYAGTDEGADLKLMVKLVNEFGAQEIINALKDMPKEEDADLVVSTAHKSKGREWDTVRLGTDFPPSNRMTDPDIRLLYVAATRAKLVLDVSECPPFCGCEAKSYEGLGGQLGKGGWVPGLSIKYSKPMPSQQDLEDWMDARRYDSAKERVTKAAEKVLGVEIPRAPTASQVKAMFEAKDSAQAQQEIAEAKRKQDMPTKELFTWARWNDQWKVRGPAGIEVGTRVTVTRKDGSTQEVTIRQVLQKYNGIWIYSN